MTAREIIKKLQDLGDENLDTECLLAINMSGGFPDDYIDVYPIESVFKRPIKRGKLDKYVDIGPPLKGYWENYEEDKKILFYVYP